MMSWKEVNPPAVTCRDPVKIHFHLSENLWAKVTFWRWLSNHSSISFPIEFCYVQSCGQRIRMHWLYQFALYTSPSPPVGHWCSQNITFVSQFLQISNYSCVICLPGCLFLVWWLSLCWWVGIAVTVKILERFFFEGKRWFHRVSDSTVDSPKEIH